MSAYFLAMAMLELGEREEAVALLEEALERREWFLLMAAHEPLFEPLRGDEGFAAVLAGVVPQFAPPGPVAVR